MSMSLCRYTNFGCNSVRVGCSKGMCAIVKVEIINWP